MWYEIENVDALATPALAVYPHRIKKNIEEMNARVGDVRRLCPHVKTHKSADVLRLFLAAGVTQFKCATISELEMVVREQASFALLAMQPVGTNFHDIVEMSKAFSKTEIATVVDNPVTLKTLESVAQQSDASLTVLLDVNNGMNRTGIECGEEAEQLYAELSSCDHIRAGGLHVYDGHIHDQDVEARRQAVESAMAPVLQMCKRLESRGYTIPKLIAGGTPSYPIHAEHLDRICSPGTPVFWDAGYAASFPDLEFEKAAVIVSRVVSIPSNGLACLDLGHKFIAAEMAHPRATFLNIDVKREVTHSEEHLVIEANGLGVGDIVYIVPRHICPTVARYRNLLVIEDGKVVGTWPVTARDRNRLT